MRMNPLINSSHFLVPFSLLILFSLFNLSHSLCHPNDKKVLLRIKSHFGNPSSLASWNPKTDCCGNWEHFNCNKQGHVKLIKFKGLTDIRATIPPFLDQLPFLWFLHLENMPHLSGPIPSSIGNLKNLELLHVSNTNVSGPIPSSLGQLPRLKELYLHHNKLITGPIPQALGQLKTLTILDLSYNKLTGPIPLTFAKLTNLSILQLNSNKLSGPVPDIVAQRLINLIVLTLDNNHLSGTLPESIGLNANFTTLSIVGNQLSGHIPKSLGRGKVMALDLSNNKFTGNASFLFEKTNKGAIYIDVGKNLLKFDFSHVELPEGLGAVKISHNMIYGSLPKGLGNLHVNDVDVSYNQLCGPIPNGQKFKHANPNNFAHNKCLCGGPLPACK